MSISWGWEGVYGEGHLGVGGLGEAGGEDRHHGGEHQEGVQGAHQPVHEVVNLDEEGEVGEHAQHEGGYEAGGDVVVGLADDVHHHLLGVPGTPGIYNGVVVDDELHHGLAALVVDDAGHDADLRLDGVPHLELKLAVLLVKGEEAEVVGAGKHGKPPEVRVSPNLQHIDSVYVK